MLAKGLGLMRTWGVLVGDVYPNAPAYAMGVQRGDVILSLNGKVMENGRQFQVNLYSHRIGESVDLSIMRGGKPRIIRVPVSEEPDDPGRFSALVTQDHHLVPQLGILGLDMEKHLISMIPFLREDTGVVVASRSSQGTEYGSKLLSGDVIHGLNGTPVKDLAGLRVLLSTLQAMDSAVLQIERRGQHTDLRRDCLATPCTARSSS